jgi:hypothetical protein
MGPLRGCAAHTYPRLGDSNIMALAAIAMLLF